MKALMIVGILGALGACASRQQDHFYVLQPMSAAASVSAGQPVSAGEPGSSGQPAPPPNAALSLIVSLPSLVERPQLVVNTGAEGITVLEHERWAAPLDDLAGQTLAQDLERRRPDLLVTGRGAAAASHPGWKVNVDIVQISARRGARMSIVAHWRIVDSTGHEEAASREFDAPLDQGSYAAIPHALSECLALLADAVAAQLPHAAQ